MPTEVAQPGLLELQGDNANLPSGGKSGHAGMFSFCLQNSSCPMFWVEYRSLGGGWALTEGGNSRKGLQKVQPERQSHEGCFVLKKGKPTVVKVWDEWGRSHRLQSQENFPPEILSAAAFEVHPPDPDQAPSSGCDVTLLSCIGNISPSFSLSMAGEGPGQGALFWNSIPWKIPSAGSSSLSPCQESVKSDSSGCSGCNTHVLSSHYHTWYILPSLKRQDPFVNI